jgi:histidinol-phosphate aminotransferase
VADAPATFVGLRHAGVLIKNLHGAHPLLEHCLRVTVGTPEENRRFLAAIAAVLGHRETGNDT